MRTNLLAPLVLLAAVACGGAARAETPEETRYAGELKACGQLPEAERKPCQDKVQAKIKADWKARIEVESRRQRWN